MASHLMMVGNVTTVPIPKQSRSSKNKLSQSAAALMMEITRAEMRKSPLEAAKAHTKKYDWYIRGRSGSTLKTLLAKGLIEVKPRGNNGHPWSVPIRVTAAVKPEWYRKVAKMEMLSDQLSDAVDDVKKAALEVYRKANVLNESMRTDAFPTKEIVSEQVEWLIHDFEEFEMYKHGLVSKLEAFEEPTDEQAVAWLIERELTEGM